MANGPGIEKERVCALVPYPPLTKFKDSKNYPTVMRPAFFLMPC